MGRTPGRTIVIIHVVDSFTERPFSGNPAGVAVVDAFPSDERMQLIAAEMNLSETAFVVARPDGEYDLRWFTPAIEVDLCGHATLAAAHVLGRPASFHTRSGVLRTSLGSNARIEMDFPADPPEKVAPPEGLAGLEAEYWGRGRSDHLVVLRNADAVRGFEPDLTAISSLGSRGLIVTSAGEGEGYDCVSRFFAPNAGVAEDPVTGSAHCTLACYWSARSGKEHLVGFQASARTGQVLMTLRGDRVTIAGCAVRVSEVHLLV